MRQLNLSLRTSALVLIGLLLFSFLSVKVSAQCVIGASANNTGTIPILSSAASPQQAIDGNHNTAATLTNNLVTGLAVLNVTFDRNMNPGDVVEIDLQVDGVNIVDWGSIGGIYITPYTETNASGSAGTRQNILGIGFIINLGQGRAIVRVPVTGIPHIRSIKIEYVSLGFSLFKTARIFEVTAKTGKPASANGEEVTVCANTDVNLTAEYTATNTPVDILWYDSNADDAAPIKVDLGQQSSTLAVNSGTQSKSYYVRTRYSDCVNSLSEPTEIKVNIDPSCALPVTFGPLDAYITNGKLNVLWQTVTEENNKRFEIQASTDGKTFKSIGVADTKALNGNSSTPLSYNFSTELSGIIALSSVAGLGVLLLLGGMFYRNKKKWGVLATVSLLIISVVTLYSCSKQADYVPTNTPKNVWVRILQIDIDGKSSASTVVKARIVE
jgi:hypothetical protein